MAGFVRRFTFFPTLQELTEIESVNIIDQSPPGIFVGVTIGTVLLVGEWPKGPFNAPTVVDSGQSIGQVFGGFSLSVTDPLGFATNPYSNGNSFVWLKNKRFRKLVLVRANLDLSEGVNLELTGTPSPLTQDIVIPAGTRVRDASAPTVEFALSADVVFAEGTDLAVSAFTAFDPDVASYSTRTVEGVPVYSTQGVSETAVADVDQVDATDLFRAGIGAGAAFPSLALAVSTGALDGAAANAAPLTVLTSGQIDTAYEAAIDSSLPGEEAVDDVTIIASARTSTAIRARLLVNVTDSSSVGRGRVGLIRPPIGTLPASATSGVDPGVGVTRSDRIFYCYPHFEQRIPELATLDPNETISSANILIGADAAMATILSVLPSEENPGQSTKEFNNNQSLISFIRKLEDGLTAVGQPTKFTLPNYISFKAAGIAALRRDGDIAEWVFQSGVTSVDPQVDPGRITIKRRRMADEIQDSSAAIAKRFSKKLRTTARFNGLVGELTDYYELLLSPNNDAQQRISEYGIDTKSGNSEELQAAGITVIIVQVRLLDSLDVIVIQTEIGEGVVVVTVVED